eukprot:TRINITY_DN11960_c0_g1_i2.p1 TRINITY_DN11960_c0_g1~~TRINITY_DN11960_c0_g1_i2.p1  ORF type:complete len:327 (+),score=40.12 TRINITY_DN11960_c0_g1_i2:112-1092(+)
MIRRPPRSTLSSSSAASDVYKRQCLHWGLVGGAVLCTLSPLRWLHPLLRKIGCPNGLLPIDMMQKLFCRGMLGLAGIQVTVEGAEHIEDFTGDALLMFSHGSNLDPFIVEGSGPIAAKWIGKNILFTLPILGWMGALLGHIAIDRSNLDRAKRSLANAADVSHRWHRAIAISPEGTRTKSGHIAEFKKGPFHLHEQLGRPPILPCVVLGAYELWPPGQLFSRPGHVLVRFVPPITSQPDMTRDQVSDLVRATMLEASVRPTTVPVGKPLTTSGKVSIAQQRAVIALVLYLTTASIYGWVGFIGGRRAAGLFTVVTLAMTLYVKKIL